VPVRTTLCEHRFDAITVGEVVGPNGPGRLFHRANAPYRWLQSSEEYHCTVWPVPEIWAVGVTDGRVAQKYVLVSP
jgi:hypothetical protein